jgi:hypothetical protein
MTVTPIFFRSSAVSSPSLSLIGFAVVWISSSALSASFLRISATTASASSNSTLPTFLR